MRVHRVAQASRHECELTLESIARGKTRTRLTRRGITFETDAYAVGEHLIWGATARILQHLFERLDSLLP